MLEDNRISSTVIKDRYNPSQDYLKRINIKLVRLWTEMLESTYG